MIPKSRDARERDETSKRNKDRGRSKRFQYLNLPPSCLLSSSSSRSPKAQSPKNKERKKIETGKNTRLEETSPTLLLNPNNGESSTPRYPPPAQAPKAKSAMNHIVKALRRPFVYITRKEIAKPKLLEPPISATMARANFYDTALSKISAAESLSISSSLSLNFRKKNEIRRG